MKIRLKPADVLFSTLIRERDGWRCVRCGTPYEPPTNGLQCSHFWGRGNKKTRFDPRNCDALCYGCHSLWEANKQGDYRTFKIAQLGQEQYDSLERAARSSISFGERGFQKMFEYLKDYGLNQLQDYVDSL